jgi:predicted transcriptional regulator
MIPDRARYLIGSDERIRLLEALSEGTTRGSELAKECSTARSTVHRNLTGFEERGWVVRSDGEYRLTPAGQRYLDAYREFAETTETIADHEPVLGHLTGVEEPIPTAALFDCETTPMTEADPHAPSVVAAGTIRRHAGEPVRIAASGISPITNRAGLDALDAGSELESVVDRRTLESLRSSYGTPVGAVVDDDRVELLVSPTPVETGVVIAGDEVCVTVHDDDGTAVASLTGSNAELRGWARRVYDRLREASDRVGPRASPADR